MSNLMKMVKGTAGLGIASMAGSAAMGSLSNMPGMPAGAKVTEGIANTGLGLANVGNLAKVGMSIIPKVKK